MDISKRRLDAMSERINELENYIDEISRINHDKVKSLTSKFEILYKKLDDIEKNGIRKREKKTTDSWTVQLLNGKIINKFANANEAARKTGIQASSIYKCLRGTNKKAGGYQWELKPFENGIQRTSKKDQSGA